MLVATAGHVDHGKTALVRALTGVDTDRLPEEKNRGLTIDLGFAYDPAGGGRRLGFIDVPGHERFVRNMLAGVPAIDLVLLVVAADDGSMPQTREHLAIVSLLGVERAVVAITKIDAVEPARVATVEAEITELLAPTPLAGAPVFPVSAITGAGIAELDAHIRALSDALPERDGSGHFRLAVDRCFTVAGAGLVVTGAVFSGAVHTGDLLRLLPGGQTVRVRGVHSQGQVAETGRAGERCALNIVGQGVRIASVQRGDWLVSPGQDLLAERVDVRLQLLESEKTALKHWTPVHVHAGSSSCTGRVALLQDKSLTPGGSALAQILLDRPTLMVYGDRLVLRDQSARRTLGGGRVIDPLGPQRGRRKPARLELLQALDTADPRAALQALLDGAPHGVDLKGFADSRNMTAAESQTLCEGIAMVRLNNGGDTMALSERRWQTLREEMLWVLGNWHAEHPDSVGPTAQQLWQACGTSEAQRLFSAALQRLVHDTEIVREGLLLRLPKHRPQLSAADQELLERVLEHLKPEQVKPPALKDLAALLALERDALGDFLAQAARRGLLVRVSATRYFHPAAVACLAAVCRRLAEQADGGLFDVRGFRDAAGIGRNAAVEVLEYLDGIGFTQRLGGHRRLNPNRGNPYGSDHKLQ